MTDFAARRDRMVERDLVGRGITDKKVVAAMERVPREEFVGRKQRALAYDDTPLPIGRGQTISQPYIVALMLQALELDREGETAKALDIGTGSGYAAAVLSLLVGHVFTIERHEELARAARTTFERLGYTNIDVRCGDGALGWPEHAPYPAILVSAAAPSIPPRLQEQLAVGGRLVIPIAGRGAGQLLLRVVRTEADKYERESLTAVRFVPLVSDERG